MAFIVKQIDKKVKLVNNPAFSLYVGNTVVTNFTEDHLSHNQKEVDSYLDNNNLEVELECVEGYCYIQHSEEKEKHYLLSAEDDSFEVHVTAEELKQLFRL